MLAKSIGCVPASNYIRGLIFWRDFLLPKASCRIRTVPVAQPSFLLPVAQLVPHVLLPVLLPVALGHIRGAPLSRGVPDTTQNRVRDIFSLDWPRALFLTLYFFQNFAAHGCLKRVQLARSTHVLSSKYGGLSP